EVRAIRAEEQMGARLADEERRFGKRVLDRGPIALFPRGTGSMREGEAQVGAARAGDPRPPDFVRARPNHFGEVRLVRERWPPIAPDASVVMKGAPTGVEVAGHAVPVVEHVDVARRPLPDAGDGETIGRTARGTRRARKVRPRFAVPVLHLV